MRARNATDIIGGGILLAVGIWAAWYSAQNYELGSLRVMGPGMFPMILGIILAVLGSLIALAACFRPGSEEKVALFVPLMILVSVISFAGLINLFGLIPAIISVTIISALAEQTLRPISVFLLCCVLSVIAWLIFSVGLGLTLPMFNWPF